MNKQVGFNFNMDMNTVMTNCIFFSIIAPYTDERGELIKEWQEKYQDYLAEHPTLSKIIDILLSDDLISCNVQDWDTQKVEIFRDGWPHYDKNLEAFRNRLIQHNLIITGKFYSKVYLKRLQELFQVTIEEVETQLCDLILEG